MMKKNLMFLALSLGLVASVNAQEVNTMANDHIKFGIKVGGNLTTLGTLRVGGEDYDYNYKPGFTAGIFSEFPLGGNFKFVPEVNFSQKGGDVEGTVAGTTGKMEQRVNYLDIPVAFSYEAVPNFSIFAGPQVSFFLNQKTKTYVNGEKTDESTDTDDIAKTLAGGMLGLGYSFTPNLNISGRYMMDFQKASSNDDDTLDKVKNNGFSLSLGYKF